jgi:hypothetical protein
MLVNRGMAAAVAFAIVMAALIVLVDAILIRLL